MLANIAVTQRKMQMLLRGFLQSAMFRTLHRLQLAAEGESAEEAMSAHAHVSMADTYYCQRQLILPIKLLDLQLLVACLLLQTTAFSLPIDLDPKSTPALVVYPRTEHKYHW